MSVSDRVMVRTSGECGVIVSVGLLHADVLIDHGKVIRVLKINLARVHC
jgi:hypothetical protein